MPSTSGVLARVHTRARWLLAVLVATLGLAVAHAPEAAAQIVEPAPIPAFKSPFGCGQVWFARTYPGHPTNAIDWNLPGGGEADFGQAVLAGAPGVAIVEVHAGYGNMVTVDHGGGWQTLYAHLWTIDVANGQTVKPDTMIGRVGNTGRSDGSHLHQEQLLNGVRQRIQVDGVTINPSYSSRGASYASGNCPAPPVELPKWGRCRLAFGCSPAARVQLP